MEAVGKHDFEGRNPKEMSFKKGSILKILTNKGENKEWLRAELDGREGLVPANYVSMKPHEWYHGRISRVEAENLVKEQKHDGAFLVRESESTPGEFSISVKFLQGVQHFKIMRDASGRFFLWLVKFSSLNQLVSYHRTASVGRVQQLPLGNPVPIPQKRPKVVALWDFHPKEEGMLQFRKGDVISLLDKTTHHDWWRGEKDGVKGIFPKTYVGETK